MLEAQVEVLDRLLELNHARYDEEVRRGAHSGKGKGKGGGSRGKGDDAAVFDDGALMPPPDACSENDLSMCQCRSLGWPV